jgi:transcriptional regulator of acetoin/glycerol metabolism
MLVKSWTRTTEHSSYGSVEDFPERVRAYRTNHVVVASDDPQDLVPLAEVARRYILRVLESVQGNKTLASRILGLGRVTLYRKLERYRDKQERLANRNSRDESAQQI